MNVITKGTVIFVIIVHLSFFLLEAVFWMNSFVYNILISLLNNAILLDYYSQAVVLKNLFINQGFYNLFLSISGIYGLSLVKKGKYSIGYTLILFLCFCGFGAGVVLACTTKAYILACLQAIPAAIAFLSVYKLFRLPAGK